MATGVGPFAIDRPDKGGWASLTVPDLIRACDERKLCRTRGRKDDLVARLESWTFWTSDGDLEEGAGLRFTRCLGEATPVLETGDGNSTGSAEPESQPGSEETQPETQPRTRPDEEPPAPKRRRLVRANPGEFREYLQALRQYDNMMLDWDVVMDEHGQHHVQFWFHSHSEQSYVWRTDLQDFSQGQLYAMPSAEVIPTRAAMRGAEPSTWQVYPCPSTTGIISA